ncbi:predicted protein [Histoplasma mississippiense (nom. inval.)]|uniref:predicted protein n=1 Tax=Ajellomyces capsulatus (strain NAm1 / WU24) TaxID=2059318 RepID=UPI000157CC8B|nr:predicted protein [Histoplasma mississippiense (nom. inval.)]EDN09904.1 predicted protein [Histoplasma mississippiense (nom. inval.)]
MLPSKEIRCGRGVKAKDQTAETDNVPATSTRYQPPPPGALVSWLTTDNPARAGFTKRKDQSYRGRAVTPGQALKSPLSDKKIRHAGSRGDEPIQTPQQKGLVIIHRRPTFSQTITTCSGKEQERTAISAARQPWMLAYGFVTVVPMTPSN